MELNLVDWEISRNVYSFKHYDVGLCIIRPLQNIRLFIFLCSNYQYVRLLQIIKDALFLNLITLLAVLMLTYVYCYF